MKDKTKEAEGYTKSEIYLEDRNDCTSWLAGHGDQQLMAVLAK